MAYQVLSRKWRPKKFQEVVGQNHITQSLINSLKNDRLGHAYLFTGTRGIGKTTVARIFAKALRCENLTADFNPCGSCPACLDFETGSSMNVLEIDGASNNSVDDVRELINNVQYLPTTGKYKVYIIDEVHMLSTSAFNALLKTLEEPPQHVVFLFATTEAQKLLGTVVSRCQRFDFRNATTGEISSLIKDIAEKENIKFVSDLLIEQLAVQGNGSFRDTLSLLDQVLSFSSDGVVTDEVLSISLGLAKQSEIRALIENIIEGDGKSLTINFRNLLNKNIGLENILKSLQNHLFSIIENLDNESKCVSLIDGNILSTCSTPELFWIFETLAKDFKWTKDALSPEKVTELTLKKVCFRREFFGKSAPNISFGSNASSVSEQKLESKPVSKPASELELELTSAPAPEKVEDAPVVEAEPVHQSEVKKDEKKSYDGFLEFLNTVSPATASNLEQGNAIETPVLGSDETLNVRIGFSESSKVFFDYLNETNVFAKIKIKLHFKLIEKKSKIAQTHCAMNVINSHIIGPLSRKKKNLGKKLSVYLSKRERWKKFLLHAKETSTKEIKESIESILKNPSPTNVINFGKVLTNSSTWIGHSYLRYINSLADFSQKDLSKKEQELNDPRVKEILDFVSNYEEPTKYVSDQELFKTIYNELEFAYHNPKYNSPLHFPDTHVTVVLISGVLNEIFSTPAFERGAQHINNVYGNKYISIDVSGTKSSDYNAKLIKEQLERYHAKHPNEKLWLIGFSKGGLDTLHYLALDSDRISDKILGFSAIASPIMGSDHLNHWLLRMINSVHKLSETKVYKYFDSKTDFLAKEFQKSLSPDYLKNWFEENHSKLPHSIFYTAVAFESSWFESHLWMKLAKMLFNGDSINDGVVDAKNAFFPNYFKSKRLGIIKGHHLVGTRSSTYSQEALLEAHLIFLKYSGLIN